MTPDERTALLERYRAGYDAIVAALAGATDAELDARPAASEWTAREVVHHLADSETMAATRLRRLLAEDDPVIHGYDENQFARRLHYDRPIEVSLATIKAVRDSSADVLSAIGEDDWARTGTHTESGPYGVEAWLRIYAAHPYDHADQIRAARASAARAGSTP